MIKLIILVGPDGSGKTTIKKELELKTNYKYFVVDRLTDSIVYNKIFNRKYIKESEILNFELKLNSICDVYLVYLKADVDILLSRVIKKREKINKLKYKKFLKKTMELFENDYLEKTYLNFITVDTGINNINECIKKIINFIEDGN